MPDSEWLGTGDQHGTTKRTSRAHGFKRVIFGEYRSKQRILDVAEKLFSDKGLDVSVRELTKKAGANLAGISYYFGSKTRRRDRSRGTSTCRTCTSTASRSRRGISDTALLRDLPALAGPILSIPVNIGAQEDQTGPNARFRNGA
jgi:hypothetical protein